MSVEVRTSIAIMVAKFFQSAMKLLFVPVFTRMLTTAEYGIVTVFESVQSTLGTITMLFLWTNVYNRGMQEFKQDRDQFTTSLLFLGNVCTVAVGAIFFAFRKQIMPFFTLTGTLWIIMFVGFLFIPAYYFWVERQKFEFRYQKMFLVTILINLFSPILAVLMIASPVSDKALAKVVGTIIVLLAAYIPLFIITYKKSNWKAKWEYVKYGIKLNTPLIPHYASQQLLSSCDRIMIAHMISESSAGIYGMVYQMSTVVMIVWDSINAVLIPWEYDKIEKGKIEEIKKLTRVLILVYAVICIGIMFVAPEAVKLFAPSGYYAGIYVMAPVIGGTFFNGLFSLLSILEIYYKKTIYVMVASSVAAVLNVILNWIFIPIFGYQAAAYTTLICYAFYSFLHALNLKNLHLSHYYDMKTIYCIMVAMIVVSVIVAQTYSGWIIRYLLLLVILLLAFWKRDILFKALMEFRKKK